MAALWSLESALMTVFIIGGWISVLGNVLSFFFFVLTRSSSTVFTLWDIHEVSHHRSWSEIELTLTFFFFGVLGNQALIEGVQFGVLGTLYSFPIRSLLELFAVYLSQLSPELIVRRCIDNLMFAFWVVLGTLDLYLFQNRRVNCKLGIFITILELLCFYSELGSGLWAFKG